MAVFALPAASRSRLSGTSGLRLGLVLAVAAPAVTAADAEAPGGEPGAALEAAAPLTGVPGIVIVEPDLPQPLPEGNAFPGGDSGISMPRQAGGTELTVQWRSERHTPGPQGIEIDGDASGVEIGVRYKLRPAILVGALAQFDPAGEALLADERSLSEHGWMAGPVTTIHLGPGLTLEARAAWGVAESGADDVAGSGAGAQRRLVSARLAHPWAYGGWRFTPSLNVTHLWEEAQGAAGTPQAAGTARVDLAPELAYRLDLARTAFIEPRAVLGGFWTFDDLSRAAPGLTLEAEPRLKAEAGVTFGLVDGPRLQAQGAVEGGDAATPDVWSGRLQLSVPLK